MPLVSNISSFFGKNTFFLPENAFPSDKNAFSEGHNIHFADNFEDAAGKNIRFGLKNGVYTQNCTTDSVVFKVNSSKSVPKSKNCNLNTQIANPETKVSNSKTKVFNPETLVFNFNFSGFKPVRGNPAPNLYKEIVL